MFLDHDIMDREIVDRDGHKVGKVDALLLELRGEHPPVVLGIEMRNGALARRAGGWAERLCGLVRRALKGTAGRVTPKFIEWKNITHIDVVVHADVDRSADGFQETERAVWERWIRPLAVVSKKRS
jgi:hypothetical protein